jgi:hypothetical protein
MRRPRLRIEAATARAVLFRDHERGIESGGPDSALPGPDKPVVIVVVVPSRGTRGALSERKRKARVSRPSLRWS